MIEIIPSTPDHVIELSKNIRKGDADEITNFGLSVQGAIWDSFNLTSEPKTVLADGKVGGMFGCIGTVLGEVGKPWLLTTHVANKYPLQFAILYRQEVRKMLNCYPILENIVDSTYHQAIKLMEIIGFTVYDEMPTRKGLFRKFRMVA